MLQNQQRRIYLKAVLVKNLNVKLIEIYGGKFESGAVVM